MTDKNFDLDVEIKEPYSFIQWKGTDFCMDFHCECGARCHFDGYFAYTVKCPHCGQGYEMPMHLFPIKIEECFSEYWRENLEMLKRDDDLDNER